MGRRARAPRASGLPGLQRGMGKPPVCCGGMRCQGRDPLFCIRPSARACLPGCLGLFCCLRQAPLPEKRVRFSSPSDDGNVVMTVITSGEFELVRWLRYMGKEVKLLSPSWLVEKLKKTIDNLKSLYD